MKKKTKTKAILEAENELLRQGALGKNITNVINTAIKVSGPVLCFYFLFRIVEVLAGKTTTSEISITGVIGTKISLNPPIISTVAVVVSLFAIFYGLAQKKLKEKVIERFQAHIANLEKEIDSKRSSSELEANGRTRREDL